MLCAISSHLYSLSWWFCVFVFVKHKTAYEMRISDWSSDVCSSDLAQHAAPCRRRPARREPLPVGHAEDPVHVLLEAAAIVGVGERRTVGHRLRPDRKSVV